MKIQVLPPKLDLLPPKINLGKFGVLPPKLGGSTGGSIFNVRGEQGGALPPHPVELDIEPCIRATDDSIILIPMVPDAG